MKSNIEITASNVLELKDKKEAIEALLQLPPATFKRVSKIVKSPKAESLLNTYWLPISMKL